MVLAVFGTPILLALFGVNFVQDFFRFNLSEILTFCLFLFLLLLFEVRDEADPSFLNSLSILF